MIIYIFFTKMAVFTSAILFSFRALTKTTFIIHIFSTHHKIPPLSPMIQFQSHFHIFGDFVCFLTAVAHSWYQNLNYFLRVSIKNTKLGGLDDSNLFLRVSESGKSKIKVLTNSIPCEGPLPSTWAATLLPYHVFTGWKENKKNLWCPIL